MKLRTWRRLRWAVQGCFVLLVLGIALRHQLSDPGTTPSLHALCPFGAVASIGTILTAGTFASKLHPSNLVLAGGVLCHWSSWDRCFVAGSAHLGRCRTC